MGPFLHAPGDILTVAPKLEVVHTLLEYKDGKEVSTLIFKVTSNRSWLVKKRLPEIKKYLKGIKRDVMAASIPGLREVRKGMIENTLSVELGRDVRVLQHFILTDIIREYPLRSPFLTMKENGGKKWVSYMVKVIGRVMICYSGLRAKRVYELKDCDVFPVGGNGECVHAFVLFYSADRNIVICCMSDDERNEWVRYIRRFIYVKEG
jgi:hypothetical protein